MKKRSRILDAILKALCEHPLLSRRQLELHLHVSSAGVRYGLRELRKRGWIWQANARQPGMRARAIYAPTRAGLEEVARQAGVPFDDFAVQTRLSTERLNRLVVTLERVFQLRTLFLWLSPPKVKRSMSRNRSDKQASKPTNVSPSAAGLWQAVAWDVEAGKLFSTKRSAVWIPFHGGAIMQREDKRWAFVVVEFDLNRAPVEGVRERFAQFVAAQDDPRYWGKEKEALFPVLLVIAQDELRLQEYYSILRSAALARQLPMPRAYLTTVRAMLSLRNDRASPIWYSTISGHRAALLFDTEGSRAPLPDRVPWRKMPLSGTSSKGEGRKKINGVITPLNPSSDRVIQKHEEKLEGALGLSELAQISLDLTPLGKRLLDEIAAHPLLTREELTLLLRGTLRWVRPALAEMCELKLIEPHESRYLVAPKGQQYLALVAGFGNAVRRYARARGWAGGFSEMVRHLEHTKAENEFFLRLAEVARVRHHRLTWLSELEGRLYYEAGPRWHSFLPDGRGAYIAGKKRYEFALEIDRSRAPLARFRGKLSEYDACISSNVLRSEGIEFLRLLVVTNSWERAEAWRRSALEEKVRFPIFITTFDRLAASGVDAPIWLRGEVARSESAATSPKVCCFECFTDKSR
jgi:DNA-binding PadR family transcriptional regulator